MVQSRRYNRTQMVHTPSNVLPWSRAEGTTIYRWYTLHQMDYHGPEQKVKQYTDGTHSIKWTTMVQSRRYNSTQMVHTPSNGLPWSRAEGTTVHRWFTLHQMDYHGPEQKVQQYTDGSHSIKWTVMVQSRRYNSTQMVHTPSNGLLWSRAEGTTVHRWYTLHQMDYHGPEQKVQQYTDGTHFIKWTTMVQTEDTTVHRWFTLHQMDYYGPEQKVQQYTDGTHSIKWTVMVQSRRYNSTQMVHTPSNGLPWSRAEDTTEHKWFTLHQMYYHGPEQKVQQYTDGSHSIKWTTMFQSRRYNSTQMVHTPSNGLSWSRAEGTTVHRWFTLHQMDYHGPEQKVQQYTDGTHSIKWTTMVQSRRYNRTQMVHTPSNGLPWSRAEGTTVHRWFTLHQMDYHGPEQKVQQNTDGSHSIKCTTMVQSRRYNSTQMVHTPSNGLPWSRAEGTTEHRWFTLHQMDYHGPEQKVQQYTDDTHSI